MNSFNEHIIPAMGGEHNARVNPMYQPDSAKKFPDRWYIIISGFSVKVFLEKMNISIGRLSKEGCPSQGRWALSNLLKASVEQKAEEG